MRCSSCGFCLACGEVEVGNACPRCGTSVSTRDAATLLEPGIEASLAETRVLVRAHRSLNNEG